MWNVINLLAFLGLNIPTKQQPVYAKRRPTGAALRNPADPVQAARIEAAAAKRERKNIWRERQTLKADRNAVHLGQAADHLLPFYIAK